MNRLNVTDRGRDSIRVSFQYNGEILAYNTKVLFAHNFPNLYNISRQMLPCHEKGYEAINIDSYARSLFSSIFFEGSSDVERGNFFRVLQEGLNSFEIYINSRSDDLAFLCKPWEILRVPPHIDQFPFKMLAGVYRRIGYEYIKSYPTTTFDSNHLILLEIFGFEGTKYIPMCIDFFFIVRSYLSQIETENFFNIIAQKGKLFIAGDYHFELYQILTSFIRSNENFKIDINERSQPNIVTFYKNYISAFRDIGKTKTNDNYSNRSLIIIRIDENMLQKELISRSIPNSRPQYILQMIHEFYKICHDWNNHYSHLHDLISNNNLGVLNITSLLEQLREEASNSFEEGKLSKAEYIQILILEILITRKEDNSESEILDEYLLLSSIVFNAYRFEESEKWLTKSLEIAKSLHKHEVIIKIYYYLGMVAREKNKIKEAANWVNEGLDIARQRQQQQDMADGYHLLGLLAIAEENFSDANNFLQIELDLCEKLDADIQKAIVFYTFSLVAIENQDLNNADKWNQKALDIFHKYNLEQYLYYAYHQCGRIARDRQRSGCSKEWHKKALKIAERLKCDQLIADEYHQLGVIAQSQKKLEDAKEWHYEALNIYKSLNLKKCIAEEYHELGVIATSQFQYDDARKWHDKSLEIFTRLGLIKNTAIEYHQLGVVMKNKKDLDDSRRFHEMSLKIFDSLGSEKNVAGEFHKLGLIAQEQNLLDEAIVWHKKALEIDQKLGLARYTANECHQLGVIARTQDQYDEAENWHKIALKIFEEIGREIDIAGEHLQLGLIARKKNQLDASENWIKGALEVYLTQDDLCYVANAQNILGEIAYVKKRYEDAIKYYGEALLNATKCGGGTNSLIESLAKIMSNLGEKTFTLYWNKLFKGHESRVESISKTMKCMCLDSYGIWIFDWF